MSTESGSSVSKYPFSSECQRAANVATCTKPESELQQACSKLICNRRIVPPVHRHDVQRAGTLGEEKEV